jgi:uncharacterized protein (TIGR02569 family)
MDVPPSQMALEGFAVRGDPQPLEGGENISWLVGDTVLKRVDVPEPQLEWQASLFVGLKDDAAFRVPCAVRSESGSLVVDGWYAMTYLPGRHERGRWVDIVLAGEAFHQAVASVPRPTFIDTREDPWAIGDRVAWGELAIGSVPETKHLRRLTDHLRAIDSPSQLIHGDLTGNVLFDDVLPPAILDLSPYFRPPTFASAIVVADALVWEGADASLLEEVARDANFPQYLLRACIYRAVTDRLFLLDQPLRPDADDPYLPAIELAISATIAGA